MNRLVLVLCLVFGFCAAQAKMAPTSYYPGYKPAYPSPAAPFHGARSVEAFSSATPMAKVNWNPVPWAVAYHIYLANDSMNPVFIAAVPSTATSYIYSELEYGWAYFFRVRAVDSYGYEDNNATDLGVIVK